MQVNIEIKIQVGIPIHKNARQGRFILSRLDKFLLKSIKRITKKTFYFKIYEKKCIIVKALYFKII